MRLPAGDIAFVCHEANRALTALICDVPVQPSWASVSEDMRASCIRGVEFALANPNATADMQHEAWAAERRAQGWVYGSVKDVSLKTHPALVPYDQLPEGTRLKDVLFRAVVQALKGGA